MKGRLRAVTPQGRLQAAGPAGGLVGYLLGDILNCYAAGPVTGDDFVGGLLGPYRGGSIENSFYDKQTTGQSNSSYGTPLTTVRMQMRSTFADADRDFVEVWNIGENQTYPF